MPVRYTAEQKLAIVAAANEAMPGRLYDWGDFMKFVRKNHGADGLSYGVRYKALKDSGLVDLDVGQPVRKRNAS